MKRLIITILAALSLTACGTIPGGTEVAAVASSAVDALTGPDTDYKNYLSHCRAEVKAQADAIKAENDALAAGLSSDSEKTQYGATLIMAFKAGQGGPKIGCTVARKKGISELLLGESDLLRIGVDLYRENRANQRFQKQLEADKELATARMEHERLLTQQNNDLLTTLTGDKLQLQESSQDDAYRRAQLEQTTRLPWPQKPLPTGPATE